MQFSVGANLLLYTQLFATLLGNIDRGNQRWKDLEVENIKDGTCFCSCAFALHILRYLCFLVWVVHTNVGLFLCGLRLCRESRT